MRPPAPAPLAQYNSEGAVRLQRPLRMILPSQPAALVGRGGPAASHLLLRTVLGAVPHLCLCASQLRLSCRFIRAA